MTPLISGMRHLTAVRVLRAGGGLITHALLCMYFGMEGYGVLGIAMGVLGLIKIIDLNTAAGLQTFLPLLRGEGAGRHARSISLVAYGVNAGVALASSAVLVGAREALSCGNPALADAFLGLAVWNLLPVVRGPVDADLMVGLRWYRSLLGLRALEHGAGVAAAAVVWCLGGTQCTYFLLLALFSLPTLGICLGRIRTWKEVLSGGPASPLPLKRFVRFCLPLTLSQCLYRVYANVGAPLVGALLSVPAAGLYRFALTLAETAVDGLAVISQAFHPVLAEARARGREAVGRLYHQAVAVTLALAVPASLALMVGSDWIAWCLSRGKFMDAAPIVEILALQVFLRTAAGPSTRILLVCEKSGWVLGLNAVKLTVEVLAMTLVLKSFGVMGAAWAHVGAALPATLAAFFLARRALGTGAGGVAGTLIRGLSTLALFWVAVYLGDLLLGPSTVFRAGLAALVLVYGLHCLVHRIRGTPAETLLRDGLFRGWPVVGRIPLEPGAPVTLVTNSRSMGGVERHVEDLARGLSRAGVPFHLVCPEDPAVDAWVRRLEATGAAAVVRAGVAAPWDLPGMWRTFRALRQTRGPVHFHLNSLDDQAPGLHLAAAAGRGPLLTTVHLSRKDRPAWGSPKHIRRRFSLPVPDHILTVAGDLGAELVETYGLPPDRVQTVRNGIEPDAFARDNDLGRAYRRRLDIPKTAFTAVFLGRLTRVKGVDVLLEALDGMEAPPQVLVVGEGPLEGELRARTERLGLPVQFLGWQEDVQRVLSAADAFVLPSHYEGLPLVVAEAMAAGLPVVATSVCGTPEIVEDGVTGFLVPPGDAHALGRALTRLVKMPARERRNMGDAGRRRVKAHFHVERQVAEVLAVYGRFDPEGLGRILEEAIPKDHPKSEESELRRLEPVRDPSCVH